MGTVVQGTAAADTISGASADGDIVWGHQGDDFLLSGPGPDVFRFVPGDGHELHPVCPDTDLSNREPI